MLGKRCQKPVCEKLRRHQPQPLAQRERLSSATSERMNRGCPQLLGIDEHFFSRKRGHTTTLCDLKDQEVQDVVPARI
ncbi:MAG: hypothetical protein JO108_02800 [Acidobacteriaceae bacterium]|nr:hypothetical protein [Acidobacteriaceae bacterium]